MGPDRSGVGLVVLVAVAGAGFDATGPPDSVIGLVSIYRALCNVPAFANRYNSSKMLRAACDAADFASRSLRLVVVFLLWESA